MGGWSEGNLGELNSYLRGGNCNFSQHAGGGWGESRQKSGITVIRHGVLTLTCDPPLGDQ